MNNGSSTAAVNTSTLSNQTNLGEMKSLKLKIILTHKFKKER